MSLEAWIIDELEREEGLQPDGPRPVLDLDRRPTQDPDAPECREVQRGVRILEISPTHDNELDL